LQRADIELALRESGISWQEQLQDTWRRKFSGHLPIDAKERAKQGRFLAYRGFSMELKTRFSGWRALPYKTYKKKTARYKNSGPFFFAFK
jgi:regulatory protein